MYFNWKKWINQVISFQKCSFKKFVMSNFQHFSDFYQRFFNSFIATYKLTHFAKFEYFESYHLRNLPKVPLSLTKPIRSTNKQINFSEILKRDIFDFIKIHKYHLNTTVSFVVKPVLTSSIIKVSRFSFINIIF